MQPAFPLDARWPELIAAVSTAIDLEATARTSGALGRRRKLRSAEGLLGVGGAARPGPPPRASAAPVRRRKIRSAEALLRLALAYGPGGLSQRAAAAWAGVSGLADLSDTAVMNRLRKAAAWLGEIAGARRRRAAHVPPTPRPPAGL